MTFQTAKEIFTTQPFQPVKITLADGRPYEILKADNARLMRNGILIGIDYGEDGIPDDVRNLQFVNIASVHPLDT